MLERHLCNGLGHAVHRFEPSASSPRSETVLLLHGFLDAGGTWDRVATQLAAAGYRVLAPDLRGFGQSDRIGAGGYYHFADYITDVRALVCALVPAELLLVGHSMGGGIATMFAGTFPERVTRLVVLEGVGPMSEPPELAVMRMRRHQADLKRLERAPRTIASLEEAERRLAVTHPRIPIEVLRTRLPHLLRSAPDGTLQWAWDPWHRSTSPTPFLAEVYASFLREISCPTLFISGGPSGWHPPDESERLALIRDLRCVEFPDAGHMMHWTAPDDCARAMLAFFEEAG